MAYTVYENGIIVKTNILGSHHDRHNRVNESDVQRSDGILGVGFFVSHLAQLKLIGILHSCQYTVPNAKIQAHPKEISFARVLIYM